MIHSIIILLVCLLLAAVISDTWRWPHPVVLIVVGVLAALVLGGAVPEIEPEIILSVFLPFLLYWEALNISLQGIRRALRGILLQGTVMVIVVALAVGASGWALGLSLATALLIGAAVGPTDATAVAALGKGIPRSGMIVLRAESLINDGTALVIFALALDYARSEAALRPEVAVWKFVLSYGGGVIVGLAIGWVATALGRHVTGAMAGNLFRLLLPFASYAVAEAIGASGVLATVIAGLYMGQTTPRFVTVESRVFGIPAWSVATYVINSLLFLLVGLQLPGIVRDLHGDSLRHASWCALVLFIVMLLARGVFAELSIRLIRLLDRRPSQRQRRTIFAQRAVLTMAGFRGAISLAVALSIPMEVAQRDVIIFITSGVVLLSLVVQGAALPRVVQWANTKENPWQQRTEVAREQEVVTAFQIASTRLLQQVDVIGMATQAPEPAVAEYRALLQARSQTTLEATLEQRDTAESQATKEFQLAMLQEKRRIMVQLRDERQLDDETLLYILELLDIEQLRIMGPLEAE